MATLYRRILGEAFDTLPPVLRAFHDREIGGSARGTLCVIHGKGRLCGLLARFAGLPRAGIEIPVRLRVVIEGPRERWIREIGEQRLETLQWRDRGLLIEAMGPIRCGFRVLAGPEGMRLQMVRAWLCALPLPAAISPRIEGIAAGCGDA